MFALGPSQRSFGEVGRPLSERAASVAYAAMAYWYYRWDWGESIAFDGLDALATADGGTSVISTFVTATVERWITDTGDGKPSRFGPAAALLRRSDDERCLAFARRIGNLLLTAPRHRAGPCLLDAPSENVFVDSLFGDPAFLASLSRLTGDERYVERAAEIVLGHCRALQDERSGLFRHVADLARSESPPIHWGRGNGWAVLGLCEFLAASPTELSGRDEITQRFVALCHGLNQHQVPGGWRNLIDREESYPESSTTAMVIAAFTLAVRGGLLDDRFRSSAERAWAIIEHRIDSSGHLIGVSYRPGVNGDPSRYEHTPAIGSYPWGQGPYLLAAAQRL